MANDDHNDDPTRGAKGPISASGRGDKPGGDSGDLMGKVTGDMGDVDAPVAATASERAQAQSFAELVDAMTSGQGLPPAMTSDERVLVDVAGMIRAVANPVHLPPSRQVDLVGAALARASAQTSALKATTPEAALEVKGQAHHESRAGSKRASDGPETDTGSATAPDLLAERRRGRLLRVLPWAVATASVAAALVLALGHPRLRPSFALLGSPPTASVTAAVATELAREPWHRSRPADALIGEIPRRHAGAASDRIDIIFADRLSGYRQLRLRASAATQSAGEQPR